MAGEAFWRTLPGAGGSGLTHSFIGKNSAGASQFVGTANRWYIKKVTVASDGLLASIGAYVRMNGGQVGGLISAVFSDNAGDPDLALTSLANTGSVNTIATSSTWRWVQMPIGLWCPAGDYWLGISAANDTSSTFEFSYDTTGGTDRRFDPTGEWIMDPSDRTVTTTTENYSIRGSLLS